MKLIISDADNNELEIMKELLELNGIPAFIKGTNTARIMPLIITKASLWVHLNEQASEALSLINDPEYEVKNKVDMDEYYKIINDFKTNPDNKKSAIISLSIFIGSILLTMFILVRILLQ